MSDSAGKDGQGVRRYSGDPDEWTLDDARVGFSVSTGVRRGCGTRPMHRKSEHHIAAHSVNFQCPDCGNVQRFATSHFITGGDCRECGEYRVFQFKWGLNR